MKAAQNRIAIIRTLATPIDQKYYNSQELGLGRALLEHSINVDVYVAGNTSRMSATTIAENSGAKLRLLESPFRKLPLIQQAWMPSVARHLKSERYDLIHVNESNELESWRIAGLAKRLSIPLMLYQGMYEPISGRVQTCFRAVFDKFCLPTLIQNTTIAMGKTRRAADFLKSKGFSEPIVLPVGLDTAPLASSSSIDWRANLAIPDDKLMVLYVGILEERRRPDLILELATLNPQFAFAIAGTGPQLEMLEKEKRNRQLDNLHLLGQVPQESLPDLYRTGNITLLPSDYEIYGMAVLESMYFGTPVIASRTAGPESIIDHEENGWLIDGPETANWQAALTHALTCPTTLNSISEAAARKIGTKLTWQSIACQYAELVLNNAHSNKSNAGVSH